MNRIVLAALAVLLLAAAGVFWFSGRDAVEAGAPPPDLLGEEAGPPGDPNALPSATWRACAARPRPRRAK